MPGLKDVSAEDLQFREYATYVERALTSKGYTVVDQIENANIVVFLVYGIGDPQEHTFTYSVPIWGQAGVSSKTTSGTANTFGSAYSWGNAASLSGTTRHSSTTTYTPAYGVIGATPLQGSFVTYTRYIFLDAYDFNFYMTSNKEKRLWKTEIISAGSSDDLRLVFPVLIAASAPYLSENTGHKVEVQLYEDSKEVLNIRGISTEKKE